jgi:cytochrome c-type biogenesis protein CcmH
MLCVMLLLLFSFPALAVEPSEVLSDPVLEGRARTIGQALRCVVCQNQSIDDSAAEVAHDMRRAVRERLTAGDSNEQVFAFMVARYGDYVLLKPPFKTGTLVLWLGAPLLLLIAGGALLVAARRRQRAGIAAPQPLSDEERQRLDELLATERCHPERSASPERSRREGPLRQSERSLGLRPRDDS